MGKRHYYIHFPENYNVPQETEREYNRMVRHEEYVEEKDEKNISFNYESEDQLYEHPLMQKKLSELENEMAAARIRKEKLELIEYALEKLKAVNELSYNILMDYYFSAEPKVTMKMIAEKYGVRKQSISIRLQRAYRFIRNEISKKIIEDEMHEDFQKK